MIKDGIKITDMNNIINAFNEHFVNIGSQLASKIVTTDNIDASSNIIDNGHSLFHTATTEKEIIEGEVNIRNALPQATSVGTMLTNASLLPRWSSLEHPRCWDPSASSAGISGSQVFRPLA